MPDSCLAPFDAKLASSAKLINLVNGATIPFQFAPRVTNTSNSSKWNDIPAMSFEPIKISMGMNGKKISVEWDYIASDSVFTGARIAQVIRDLNAYFFKFTFDVYPLVKFSFGEVVPDGAQFRLMQADISYGPEIVASGGKPYYFYTKVATSLELATNISPPGPPKMNVKPLAPIDPKWY